MVEHRRLEVVVIIEEEEGLFEVNQVVSVLEVGKALGVLDGEVGQLVGDMHVSESVGDTGQCIIPNLVSERRSSSRFCPSAWPGKEAGRRRRLSVGIRAG